MHWLAPRRIQQLSTVATAELDVCCPKKQLCTQAQSQLSQQLHAIQVAQQSHTVAWILLCSMVVA